MLLKKENLILADKLAIYNNLAKINDCEGRLLVELQIYPKPRIIWDFEVLGVKVCQFPTINDDLRQSFFTENSLRLENLNVSQNYFGEGVTTASGNASQVYFGNQDETAHIFQFCLTNTKFQEVCLTQDRLEETVHEKRFISDKDKEVLRKRRNVGKFIEASLNSIWTVRLEIEAESLDWLDSREGNIGIRLTGYGEINQIKSEDFLSSLTNFRIIEAQEMLRNLCWLLSYANGGFVAPIFIEGKRYEIENNQCVGIQTVATVVKTNYQVASLEQLRGTWLTEYADLRNFISCFSNFEKMLALPFWKDTFYFVVIQYFQAIRAGNWELAASATGSALERLSHAILVEDETNATKRADCELLFDINQQQAKNRWNLGRQVGQENISVTGKRLRLLLERIGLTASRGYNDIQDVKDFLDVRNDAVHPKVSAMTQENRWLSIMKGIQWIDEVLLWRLGYDGKYCDRVTLAAMLFPIAGSTSASLSSLEITPRYDLSLRDPSW